jgi:hypothetical protein
VASQSRCSPKCLGNRLFRILAGVEDAVIDADLTPRDGLSGRGYYE